VGLKYDPLTASEVHRLRMYEKKVLTSIFGPKEKDKNRRMQKIT
jgi:hypothetical protein